jgi:hypothetical protein
MANVHWSYYLGGDWNTPGYWSGDAVPGADSVVINIPGAFVTSDGNVLINSIGIGGLSVLTIGNDSLFTVTNGTGSNANHGFIKVLDHSTLQVAGGTFDNKGTIMLGRAAAFMVDGQVILDGGGTIAMTSQTGSGIIGQQNYPNPNAALYNVDNHITVSGTGAIYGLWFDNETGGVVESGSGSDLEIFNFNVAGAGFENYGRVAADDGGTVDLFQATGAAPIYNFGTFELNSSGDDTYLRIGGDVRLTGYGNVVLSDNIHNYIVANDTAATLENVNNTISGSGAFWDQNLALVNDAHGEIIADHADALLGIITGSLTNAGSLIAENGATLGIVTNGAVQNSGLLDAENGTIDVYSNVAGNGNAWIFSGSQLDLYGTSNKVAVTFVDGGSGDTGALLLGHSLGGGGGTNAFKGTVAGFVSDGTHSDSLILQDIGFAAGNSWSFNENAGGTGGTLSVNDTAGDTAKIALLGQYLAAGGSATSANSNLFRLSADHIDNTGGTLVTTSFHGP